MRAMTVRESIEAAFADVPYPGDDRIADHQNCLECEDVRGHFRGATWRGHTLPELRQYQDVLPLFTPEALQYFIPAYMLVSLDAWQEADLIPFSILNVCVAAGSGADAGSVRPGDGGFSVFTRPQRAALAAYLQEWVRSDSYALGAEDVPAAVERLLGRGPAG